MERKKQTFWQIVKRFFEPARKDKKMYLKGAINPILWSGFPALIIILVQLFLDQIGIENYDLGFKILLLYVIVFVFNYIVQWFTRYFRFSGQYFKLSQILQKERYKKFYLLDNTEVEKLGTGKIIGIIENGIKTRAMSLIQTQKWIIVN